MFYCEMVCCKTITNITTSLLKHQVELNAKTFGGRRKEKNGTI
jgi:hypothetical protein